MSKITATSHLIDKNLYLVQQTISAAPATVPVELPTNHLAVIDVSGSMSADLPKIREQLKKKLPKLLKDDDTLSMIWFSGRGQCGVLLEAEPVATLKDLNDVNKAVDRWLKPVGLTGFKEPIEEAGKLIAKIGKKNKNPFSLFFMSDGCDNQFPRAEILKAVQNAASGFASATFVEYGYYADRALLAAMAEKAGGVHIHADSFDAYEPVFAAAMAKRPVGGKRVEVAIGGDPVHGFVFSIEPGSTDLTTFEVVGNKAFVPEAIEAVFYLSPVAVGTLGMNVSDQEAAVAAANLSVGFDPCYAAMSLFAVRMKPDIVYPLLKATGDVSFIDSFSTCFGKQRYSEFMASAQAAAFDSTKRFVKGRDPNKVPADDAFTVLDLLNVLAEDSSTRLLFNHPEFKYSRISRGRVNADENLTADEALQVEAIRAQMAGEKNAKKLKELQLQIDGVLAAKKDALIFVPDEAPDGYEVSGLVYNECSPNISVRVQKTGTVDLSARIEHAQWKIPTQFRTHIWRNYAIVSHGLVNVNKLPVRISKDVERTLALAGVVRTNAKEITPGTVETVIDLGPLPVINRKMVKAVSAKEAVELEWQLLQARAAQKVYKAYQDELFPGVKQKGFADLYTADGANWLKDQGLTSGGFSPKSIQAESVDFILGKELDVKIKGCSKLDSVKAVKDKITAKKKLNPCDEFMKNAIEEVDGFVKKNPKNLHEKWLTGQAQAQIAKTRGLIYQSAVGRFTIVIGQIWYSEFKTLDENQLTVKIGGVDVNATLELREIEIKV